jgi:hypothetical protein
MGMSMGKTRKEERAGGGITTGVKLGIQKNAEE